VIFFFEEEVEVIKCNYMCQRRVGVRHWHVSESGYDFCFEVLVLLRLVCTWWINHVRLV